MSAQNTHALRRSLMEAAEQCITVEFVMLETEAAFLYDGIPEYSNGFIDGICDLENCVVRRYCPEMQVLHGLVKRWLEELKDDKEEALQAVFVFRGPLISSVSRISCSIYPSANHIIDGFPSCQDGEGERAVAGRHDGGVRRGEGGGAGRRRCGGGWASLRRGRTGQRGNGWRGNADVIGAAPVAVQRDGVRLRWWQLCAVGQLEKICRCHGHPIDPVNTNKAKWLCPITARQLAASDVIDSAVKIGEKTVLFLPASEGSSNPQRASNSISFVVIERTKLASLNEGLVMGTPHVVIPSSNDVELTLYDESADQNTQLFYGLCEALFKLDEGLVCSSECNTETMKIGTLQCYYLLQPSEKGPMLLRRLAGSEEILPLPDVSRPCYSTVTMEVKNSIETSLSKIVLKDYNPLQHERGFHSRLNCLVKDSLQFGSIAPESGLKDSHHLDSFSEPQMPAFRGPEENKLLSPCREKADHLHSFSQPQVLSTQAPKENKLSSQSKEEASPGITEEWEQLIIMDDDFSAVTSRPAAKPQTTRLPSPVKPLDEKTSRILERLEAPRAKKQRASKPSTGTSTLSQTKKPLLPFEPSASQPLRPTFNKLRRKTTAAI
ncbi:hypothetical protein GUJ93_ZPchr0008g11731 [Zizania palustris]|uniref:Uncharacterized protein n=2 Tax=Zizania palustris TaxID=103762 RepID=A0A8J5RVQ8_ZIZPA|nr:hypothetical protein GUJ93_ZPchr0008g11731 [Zizania palustris]